MSQANHSTLTPFGQQETLGWNQKLKRFPWSLLALLLIISGIGLVILYSAVGGDESLRFLIRQLSRLSVGILFMLFIAFLGDEKLYRRYAYLIYAITLMLLVGVFVSGSIGMGARRWLELGPIRLQPSELMKVSLVLALSRYFHDRAIAVGFGWRDVGIPFLMILAPLALIIKQPDLGTGIVMSVIGVVVIVVAGLNWQLLLGSVVALGASLPLVWSSLHDYQRQRVITLFSPEQDPLGSGYHIIQSKIAVGSGGITGKGFMAGSQSHLDFLPERHTDFIFSVLAEEWGFLGCMVLLTLYLLITLRGLIIASLAHDRFGLLVSVGLISLFALQVIINIGMVIGLLPVVGIPLPLISYGGSSLITVLFAMGLLCHVNIHSKYHGKSV